MLVRAKNAGEILGVSANTVRVWCREGKLEFTLSAAGQRLFDTHYLESKKKEMLGIEESSQKVFYVRSSGDSDVSLETQEEKLRTAYGEDYILFSDKASGLKDNRKGLEKLLDYCKLNSGSLVYVTNEDRLTRFGFNYLRRSIEQDYGCELIVLDSKETKEPHEVLMNDFMSLIASFSGKFYRLRGWEQRKKFLDTAKKEVENNAKNSKKNRNSDSKEQ